MASVKISDLTAKGGNAALTDLLEIEQTTGESRKLTVQELQNLYDAQFAALAGLSSQNFSANDLTAAGVLNVDDTTESTSTTTGSTIIDGGLGIAKNLNVGGDISVDGNLLKGDFGEYGLIGSAGVNPLTDIIYPPGQLLDSTKTYNLKRTTAIEKRHDLVFAAGTLAGGNYTAGLAAGTEYYVFAIMKDSDSSIDIYSDISITADNIPGGYTSYAFIHWFITDGSSQIIPYTTIEKNGREITMIPFARVSSVITAGTQGTTPILHALNVPTGFECDVDLWLTGNDVAAWGVEVYYPGQTAGSFFNLIAAAGVANQGTTSVTTNTAQQVYASANLDFLDTFQIGVLRLSFRR